MVIKKSKKIQKHRRIRKGQEELPEEFKKKAPELEKLSEKIPEKESEEIEISSDLVLNVKAKAPVLETIEKQQNSRLEEQVGEIRENKMQEIKEKDEFRIYNPETYKAPQDYTLSDNYQDFSKQMQNSNPVRDRFRPQDHFIPSNISTRHHFKNWEKSEESYPELVDANKRQSYETEVKKTIRDM